MSLTVEGPGDRWFAIAFGAKNMAAEPYAFIVDDNLVHERRLGKHNAGVVLTQSKSIFWQYLPFGMLSILAGKPFKDTQNRRSAIITRQFEGDTDDYYSFTTALKSINLLVASGASSGDSVFGGYHSATPCRRNGSSKGQKSKIDAQTDAKQQEDQHESRCQNPPLECQ